ncbi:MAG: TatD family hydrolase [Acidimicrobiales bacterium]|nr:TatD family hydrolase [Acidimicrobiales bacterium]
MWTDSHCHVGYEGVPTAAVADAVAAGVTRLITVGTDFATSTVAVEVARAHPGMVFATVGLHPHEAAAGVASLGPLLADLDPTVVAIGECGLDYYYEHSPRPAQRAAFAEQIALAASLGLTLVVHTRDAWDETFDILAGSSPSPARWVLHCFSGGPAEARRGLDMGAFLSFSGIVSFKNAGETRAAAALCPPDRLLVETDSPYLAPVPNRGRPNQPAWVPLVGAAVASARGVPVEEIERQSWDNATAAFGLHGAVGLPGAPPIPDHPVI